MADKKDTKFKKWIVGLGIGGVTLAVKGPKMRKTALKLLSSKK